MPGEFRWRILNRLRAAKNPNPSRIVVSSFGVIIFVGTLLLMLPLASQDGQGTDFLTCLFTATSASCVTGLILVYTWIHWSLFAGWVGVRNYDCTIVAVADDVGNSALITMNLKEMGVPKVIAKAQSHVHQKVLQKIGADKVVLPEHEIGVKLAQGLSSSNV